MSVSWSPEDIKTVNTLLKEQGDHYDKDERNMCVRDISKIILRYGSFDPTLTSALCSFIIKRCTDDNPDVAVLAVKLVADCITFIPYSLVDSLITTIAPPLLDVYLGDTSPDTRHNTDRAKIRPIMRQYYRDCIQTLIPALPPLPTPLTTSLYAKLVAPLSVDVESVSPGDYTTGNLQLAHIQIVATALTLLSQLLAAQPALYTDMSGSSADLYSAALHCLSLPHSAIALAAPAVIGSIARVAPTTQRAELFQTLCSAVVAEESSVYWTALEQCIAKAEEVTVAELLPLLLRTVTTSLRKIVPESVFPKIGFSEKLEMSPEECIDSEKLTRIHEKIPEVTADMSNTITTICNVCSHIFPALISSKHIITHNDRVAGHAGTGTGTGADSDSPSVLLPSLASSLTSLIFLDPLYVYHPPHATTMNDNNDVANFDDDDDMAGFFDDEEAAQAYSYANEAAVATEARIISGTSIDASHAVRAAAASTLATLFAQCGVASSLLVAMDTETAFNTVHSDNDDNIPKNDTSTVTFSATSVGTGIPSVLASCASVFTASVAALREHDPVVLDNIGYTINVVAGVMTHILTHINNLYDYTQIRQINENTFLDLACMAMPNTPAPANTILEKALQTLIPENSIFSGNLSNAANSEKPVQELLSLIPDRSLSLSSSDVNTSTSTSTSTSLNVDKLAQFLSNYSHDITNTIISLLPHASTASVANCIASLLPLVLFRISPSGIFRDAFSEFPIDTMSLDALVDAVKQHLPSSHPSLSEILARLVIPALTIPESPYFDIVRNLAEPIWEFLFSQVRSFSESTSSSLPRHLTTYTITLASALLAHNITYPAQSLLLFLTRLYAHRHALMSPPAPTPTPNTHTTNSNTNTNTNATPTTDAVAAAPAKKGLMTRRKAPAPAPTPAPTTATTTTTATATPALAPLPTGAVTLLSALDSDLSGLFAIPELYALTELGNFLSEIFPSGLSHSGLVYPFLLPMHTAAPQTLLQLLLKSPESWVLLINDHARTHTSCLLLLTLTTSVTDDRSLPPEPLSALANALAAIVTQTTSLASPSLSSPSSLSSSTSIPSPTSPSPSASALLLHPTLTTTTTTTSPISAAAPTPLTTLSSVFALLAALARTHADVFAAANTAASAYVTSAITSPTLLALSSPLARPLAALVSVTGLSVFLSPLSLILGNRDPCTAILTTAAASALGPIVAAAVPPQHLTLLLQQLLSQLERIPARCDALLAALELSPPPHASLHHPSAPSLPLLVSLLLLVSEAVYAQLTTGMCHHTTWSMSSATSSLSTAIPHVLVQLALPSRAHTHTSTSTLEMAVSNTLAPVLPRMFAVCAVLMGGSGDLVLLRRLLLCAMTVAGEEGVGSDHNGGNTPKDDLSMFALPAVTQVLQITTVLRETARDCNTEMRGAVTTIIPEIESLITEYFPRYIEMTVLPSASVPTTVALLTASILVYLPENSHPESFSNFPKIFSEPTLATLPLLLSSLHALTTLLPLLPSRLPTLLSRSLARMATLAASIAPLCVLPRTHVPHTTVHAVTQALATLVTAIATQTTSPCLTRLILAQTFAATTTTTSPALRVLASTAATHPLLLFPASSRAGFVFLFPTAVTHTLTHGLTSELAPRMDLITRTSAQNRTQFVDPLQATRATVATAIQSAVTACGAALLSLSSALPLLYAAVYDHQPQYVTSVCFAAARAVKALAEVAKKQPLTRLALELHATVLKTHAHKMLGALYPALAQEAKNAQDASHTPSPEAILTRSLLTDVLAAVHAVWALSGDDASPLGVLVHETVLKSMHLVPIWNAVVNAGC